MPETMTTMDEIRAKNRALGHHWFDTDTLRFFRSRLPKNTVDGSDFFISSEQFDDDSPRLYTIRHACADGSIETVGEFQAYKTRAEAEKVVRESLLYA